MPAALDKTYDGIIVGAGHHGLVLGSLSRQMRPRHPAGGPPAAIRRRAGHRGGDRAGLLPQPAFDQSFPHQRDAVVQGPQPRRPRRPTSRRATSSASRISTARRWSSAAISRRRWPTSRASPRRTRRPSATGTARPRRSPRKSSCPSGSPIRCRRPSARRCCRKSDIGRDFLAVTRRQPFDVVKELFENEHVQLLFLFKISLFGTWLVDTHVEDEPDGLGDPRLRPAERLPALQGRLVQSGARADGDLHRRRRALSRRRSSSTRSSSRAARRPASR